MPLPGQSAGYGSKMVTIVGPDGSTAEVGDLSTSLQTTPYDAAGSPLATQPDASFILPVDIRQTTAATAGAAVWMLCVNNGAGSIIAHIRRIRLEMTFDGEVAAATTVRYQICRCSGARPTGGTDMLPILCDPGAGDVSLYIASYLDTGLTDAGVTYETAAAVIGLPLTAMAVGVPLAAAIVSPPIAILDLSFGERHDPNGGFQIRAVDAGGLDFEGLAIRVGGLDGGATVVGIALKGYVMFDQRTSV